MSFTQSNGVRMPPILYGTAWKKARTAELVETAIRAGFRGVDTACQPKHYHEPGVGVGVRACLEDPTLALHRHDLYLQTKYTPVDGQDPRNIPYDATADLRTQLEQSVSVSLKNLATEYIDCLVLHSPLHPWTRTLEVWKVMEDQVAAGTVRQLGISNCYDLKALTDLYDRAHIKPVVLQNRFYDETGFDREIRAFCRDQSISYQSFWTLTANPELLVHPTLQAASAVHRASPAQILFRYLTHVDVVPLTGTKSLQHMREDLSIFDFELDSIQCEDITALITMLAGNA